MPPLRALVDAGHDVRIVVTQPDRRRGRGGATTPSPVKAAAQALGLPVTERVLDVVDADVELGVVVAFGRLIKPNVLERVPMINVHFSLLPRWRGAAPVERAILAGDDVTGVGIMQLEEGLDTGPIYTEQAVDIRPDETAAELRGRLVDIGTKLLVELLAKPLGEPTPQEGEPVYAAKITPDELRIDWSKSTDQVLRLVRIGHAWTTIHGKRLQVLRAEPGTGPTLPPGAIAMTHVGCGSGPGVRLLQVKPEGKGAQDADAWARGARLQPGDRLGE